MEFEVPAFPSLRCNAPSIERAYRIATGDLLGNIQPFPVGHERRPVLLAGLDYDTPWTRDAAINVWNALGVTHPAIARNTLLSVVETVEGEPHIGGQYWDAIIWVLGLWAYYLASGDKEFLRLGYRAALNSLRQLEAEEYDPRWGLFRGPAVYGDGVAAYPDRYSPGPVSGILDWVKFNRDKKAPAGYGLPMMTLSTNCVYAQVYRTLDMIAMESGVSPDPRRHTLARELTNCIQRHFWNPRSSLFDYLVDEEGRCESQEGLGHAFALLFDIASAEQAISILGNLYRTSYGIACLWPTFARYEERGGFGRHSGTIWPFINAFWAEAALKYKRHNIFDKEFFTLTALINRYAQCAEIYHPLTGEIYGGLQEAGKGESGWEWESCARQSWSASGYLRMLLFGVVGMRLAAQEVAFTPYLPAEIDWLEISDLPYRRARLDIRIERGRGNAAIASVDGEESIPSLPSEIQGKHSVEIILQSTA